MPRIGTARSDAIHDCPPHLQAPQDGAPAPYTTSIQPIVYNATQHLIEWVTIDYHVLHVQFTCKFDFQSIEFVLELLGDWLAAVV